MENQPKVTVTENGKEKVVELPSFGEVRITTSKGKITFIHKTESQVMDQ